MTRVAELDTRENELKEKLERTNARLAEVQQVRSRYPTLAVRLTHRSCLWARQALGSRKVSAKTRGLRDVSVLARTSSVREAANSVSRAARVQPGPLAP